MINILLFHNTKQLNSSLRHHCGGVENVKVITPNPALADIARVKFESSHQSIETITVSSFLKNELKQLVDPERLENFKGKSELNLLLGALWKKFRPDSSYELFKRSFQMLTDFRSFSMNENVLETVLEDYSEELAGAVFWFHKVMMEMDIIDEHRSYFLLSERLREGDLPPLYKTNQTYVFWGFDFLTASQVDLLNAMGIRENVIVPFYKYAYSKSSDLDWIKWLSKNDAQIIDTEESKDEISEINVIPFAKNYLSKTLKSIQSNEIFKDKKINYVLGTKNLSSEFISELPVKDISYKVSIDIFKEKLGLVRESLNGLLDSGEVFHSDKAIELLRVLAQESLKNKDYRLYKLISLTVEQIISWVNLSEDNEVLGEFDLNIIFDSVGLNTPRNSLADSSEGAVELKTLKTIDKQENSDVNLLCVTSDYGPVKGSVVQYSENVEKYLASIGPIRRSELEFLQLKSKIQEFLNQTNTYVLVENGVLEHDLGWSSIIEEDLKREISINSNIEVNRDFSLIRKEGKDELKSISATRLQSFSDCPRKYFFNYLEKKSPRIELPGQLNFMQLGLIEHEVIENYLQEFKEFDEDKFIELVEKTFQKYQEQISFREDLLEEYKLEIIALCTNVLKELITLNNMIGLELRCEVNLPNNEELNIQGSIDCLGKNSDTLVILDFKRGGGSIPSQIGLKAYKKIQLWFYLERMRKNNLYSANTKLIWGYVNLSSLEDSLIFCSDEVLTARLKAESLKMFKKLSPFDEQMSELLDEYSEFETNLIQTLKTEEKFIPNPIDAATCGYCSLSNVCPRGEV